MGIRIATPVNLIIINDNNLILLLRRAEKEDQFYGFWSIPGGGPNLSETYEEALKREILEETGTSIIECNYFKSFYYVVNENLHVRSVYFYGSVKGEVKIDHESLEYHWFSFDEIKDENFKLAYNQKEILLNFINSR